MSQPPGTKTTPNSSTASTRNLKAANPIRSVNRLFSLLQSIEAIGSTGTIAVRRRGGTTIGVVRLVEGQVYRVAGRNSFRELCEAWAAEGPEIAADAKKIAQDAVARSEDPWDCLLAEDLVPPERVTELFHGHVSQQMRGMARGSHADHVVRVLSRADCEPAGDLNCSPLDVFLHAARALDTAGSDEITELYQHSYSIAQFALLLAPSSDASLLPLPVACHGLPDISLRDLVTVCRGAQDACRPPGFKSTPLEAEYIITASEESGWFNLSGESHLLMLKLESRYDVVHILSKYAELRGSRSRDETQ
ncbi:MAG: hypothetical protein N2C14_26120 [Planctomycetales bacterium]